MVLMVKYVEMSPVLLDDHMAWWHRKGSEKSCFNKGKKTTFIEFRFPNFMLTFAFLPCKFLYLLIFA